MFQASLSTRHFEFSAFGQTQDEALLALESGLALHAQHYGLGDDWFDEMREDIKFLEFELGQCFKDGEKLSGRGSNPKP